jgi:sarcosine oxidase
MTRYDVAIVGLGAMGSACAYHVGNRKASAVAFDQFAPPHTLGSSHGHTRIIREAYYEHPLYVPLVQRSYELWDTLEQEQGAQLRVQTGGLMVGPPSGELFRGALASAQTHKLAHEILSPHELSQRFPAYRASENWSALLEHRAGMLFPERCVAAHLAGAREREVVLRTNEAVIQLEFLPDSVAITTQKDRYEASRAVIAAGPWLPALASSLDLVLPLEIERQLSHWFVPTNQGERFDSTHAPIGLWETRDGEVFATLPDEGHGVKCGMHHAGASTSPETVNRNVTDSENEAARRTLEGVMPGAGGRLKESRVCLYTNTPDRHFIIDWAMKGRALVVSPCSGHGFKFASAIGEVAAELVTNNRTWLDLTPFSLSRFQ